MSNEERIVEFMRREGPVLPNKLAQFLGTNLIIAGAHLSELSSRKVVLVTHFKIGGGSPIYYLPGQEDKLVKFYDELNSKDRVSFDLLKEGMVLRDKDLDPLTRVSLRNIKDFAKPLEVSLNGEKEVFWKWYLLKNEEVGVMIKELIKPKIEEEKVEVVKVETRPEVKEKIIEKPIIEEKSPEPPKVEEKKVEEQPPIVKEEVEVKKVVVEEKRIESKPEPEKVVEKEIPKPDPIVEKQEVLEREEKKEIKKEVERDFLGDIKDFFSKKKIKIEEEEIFRKTEINYIVKMPTPIGEIMYYVKAKSKKKCNDKDVSSAFLEGQMKKLPVLFLYSGEMTKKAEEMLQQDIFKNLILLHLG